MEWTVIFSNFQSDAVSTAGTQNQFAEIEAGNRLKTRTQKLKVGILA